MIEITIRNFQSIESLTVTVDGLTTLVGKSNIGKSAVIRAISAALMNLPVTGMVRKGAPHCSVEMKSDTYHLLWEKGEKGINRYTVNGKVYDKVGAKPLHEIEELGFKQVEVGSSWETPWFASQFSPIFLLDKSGSQVTEFISEVSRLRTLQDAIGAANKGKKSNQDTANAKSASVKTSETVLERLQDLDKVQKLGQDLEQMLKSVNDAEVLLGKAEGLDTKIGSLKDQTDQLEEGLGSIPGIRDVDGLGELEKSNAVHRSILKSRGAESILAPISNIVVKDRDLDPALASIRSAENANRRAQSVRRMSHDIKVPQDPGDLVTKLQNAVSMKARIDRIKSSISSPSPTNPAEPVINVDKVKTANQLNVRLKSLAIEIRELKGRHVSNEADIQAIQQEMDKIPKCPSCDKPL